MNSVHATQQHNAGFNTRLAVLITKAFGSIWAFYVLIAWMLLWMGLATAGVWLFKVDHYPFPFLLFLSNLVQLWALPVLAFGQVILGRKQEILQNDEAFKTTQNSYHDIEQVVAHLSVQDTALTGSAYA